MYILEHPDGDLQCDMAEQSLEVALDGNLWQQQRIVQLSFEFSRCSDNIIILISSNLTQMECLDWYKILH